MASRASGPCGAGFPSRVDPDRPHKLGSPPHSVLSPNAGNTKYVAERRGRWRPRRRRISNATASAPHISPRRLASRSAVSAQTRQGRGSIRTLPPSRGATIARGDANSRRRYHQRTADNVGILVRSHKGREQQVRSQKGGRPRIWLDSALPPRPALDKQRCRRRHFLRIRQMGSEPPNSAPLRCEDGPWHRCSSNSGRTFPGYIWEGNCI